MAPDTGSYVSIINGFAASITNQLTSAYTTISSVVNRLPGAIELLFLVPYEALVLSYLSLALLIGALELLAQYAGVSIPIPGT